MDVKSALIRGLQAFPKYLPIWFRYDTQGSIYNDLCLSDNKYYYFAKSEVEVIGQYIDEIVRRIPEPCVLIDMGSGDSVKSRIVIDALLKKQTTLRYVPVDVSAEYLREASDACSRYYGDVLEVTPIAGDYSVGINAFREIEGNKLILWLGGLQNESYDAQVEWIRCLSKNMSDNDMLLFTVDATDVERADEIINAYKDPTGFSKQLYLNALWRLNREYGSDVDTDEFDIVVEFVPDTRDDKFSGVRVSARSKRDQTVAIPGLGIDVMVKDGESIYLHDGEYVSCKYSMEQIHNLVQKGHQTLEATFMDSKRHAALCCVRNIISAIEETC